MRPFHYTAVETVEDALLEAGAMREVSFIAGGTNLLDLMKEDVMRPVKLVDISRMPLDQIEPTADGGLLLGALARNADTAYHPLVRERYPLLSQTLLAGASPQLRNMASNGGNLLQRTRCYYFYDVGVPCNKRQPGSGCPARTGLNRLHAVLGTSQHCIATHPSDMCVALAALDAQVHVSGSRGERTTAMQDFHRLPGDRPDLDNTLAVGELITGIELPAEGFAAHSAYLKLRDRQSYAFALVSVAAALDLDENGHLRDVRVALGGVAHKPWRDRAAEQASVGRPACSAVFSELAQTVMEQAVGQGQNDFKIPLARLAIVRALEMALGMPADQRAAAEGMT